MYIPDIYLEQDWSLQEDLIKKYPLATVVTNGKEGLIANHIPFVLRTDSESGKKYLHAHLAKVNHQIPSLKESTEVLVIFQTDDSYISPSYYPTKQETHKVVPTWDFGAIHIYGKPRIIDDKTWVRSQLDALTEQQEKELTQWTVDEAPERYVELIQKSICGLEIEIERTECKMKFEQKMKEQDIKGTICGLAKDGKQKVSDFVAKCNHFA
ncbi:hypothetical protein CANINC_001366 [Pichia inconspicua]|uniref:Transcriptional regulator n=1 Tax=Pichia inconspicua TaxID=52247 RepID=A0A4V4NFZ7_9ASCO|nr:hypothetical protein CANINC_001366 [[Candida] inconspicua]